MTAPSLPEPLPCTCPRRLHSSKGSLLGSLLESLELQEQSQPRVRARPTPPQPGVSPGSRAFTPHLHPQRLGLQVPASTQAPDWPSVQ